MWPNLAVSSVSSNIDKDLQHYQLCLMSLLCWDIIKSCPDNKALSLLSHSGAS